MRYKTILVHLNDERRAAGLIEAAGWIAREGEAHLAGLHVFPMSLLMPQVTIPVPMTEEIRGQIRATIQRDAERIHQIFEDTTRGQPFVAEWRAVVSENRDTLGILLQNARSADLVVTSQADPEWRYSKQLDFADKLVIEAGRPVLVIPSHGTHRGPFSRVVVAWNGSREAARATFDALPLLTAAERVVVLSVGGDKASDDSEPAEGIAEALARHGARVEVLATGAGALTTGEEIRTQAIDNGADLIVMGAYGHSRFREFAFGGATRHMLRDMTVPVLFSH